MVDFNLLPNCMIIGAPKSASTSLFDALSTHPQVFMSTKKEPNFFSVDKNYERGLEWYLSFFEGAAGFPVRGEGSVRYLDRSLVSAYRIKDLYQDRPLRFILIFRDPAERAYSGYWQAVRDGTEDLPFEEALAAEQGWFENHKEVVLVPENERKIFFIGRYATHLQPFLDQFDRSCFLFLLTDDLKKDFTGSVNKTLVFLGIDPDISVQRTHSNPAAIPRSRSLHRFLSKESRVKSLLKHLIPTGIRGFVRRSNLREFRYPPLDDSIKNELRRRYLDETRQLEEITGRDLSAWYPT
jgi:hypothetical protein